MSIGSTIKKLRREREMTQEQLAECLGITANAVSQWECDRTAPDIAQLPILARVLQVSTDRLLGIDFSKDEEEIRRISEESLACYRTGQFTRAVEIARGGLRQYPQSFHLMARLAESLQAIRGSEHEMERLCNKILKECTENGPRDRAYRLKIILYGKRGQYDEILDMASDLPHIWVSQEETRLRWDFGTDEARRRELIRYAKMHVESLTTCFDKIARLPCYTAEEQIRIRMQVIELMQALYPAGDYLHHGAILASQYCVIASLHAQSGACDQALHALEQACAYAVYCDGHDGTGVSLAFRGYGGGEMHTEERSYRREFAELIRREPAFEPLREDPRYKAIMETLNEQTSGGMGS